jgi:hypothetical protein
MPHPVGSTTVRAIAAATAASTALPPRISIAMPACDAMRRPVAFLARPCCARAYARLVFFLALSATCRATRSPMAIQPHGRGFGLGREDVAPSIVEGPNGARLERKTAASPISSGRRPPGVQ